jgi:predicted dehydrogenase
VTINSALVFGSNFALKAHFKSLKEIKEIKNLNIYSPNIKKKKLFIKKEHIVTNLKKFSFKNIDLISVGVPPIFQKKICMIAIKNKIKFIFLEKPISNSIKETIKILNILKKKKINFCINFIYPNIHAFKVLKKKILKIKIKKILYKWKFEQTYFKNYLETWKIKKSEGGGIVDFYLIHIFYNLLFLFGKFKIKKVEFFTHKELIYKLELNLLVISKNIEAKITIDIKNKEKLHSIEIFGKKKIYEVSNKTNDWVKNFYLYINKKKFPIGNKVYINRAELTKINLRKLISVKVSNEEILNFRLAHQYCSDVNKRINLLNR